MSEESKDHVDNEVDEIVEKLSEEDQKLLDEALANLMGFIEQETTIGYWVEEDQIHLTRIASRQAIDR